MDSQEATARDPVCGATVPRTGADDLSEEYAGVTYVFCSQACLERFIQDTDIFTLDIPLGPELTRDRGIRSSVSPTPPVRVTFEQSHT